MKPRHLEFCGINSFSRKAVIDFDKLLAGGLFGIFGDTGSGKTTVLDSIVFALYGKIDRTRGGAGSDIINYGSDKAQVLFDFEIETAQGRKIYRVEREIKRKNSLQSVVLYELSAGRIIALSDGVKNTNPKIQEIIGLSFDDFKKCIALPQGEFAQFVKSERADRLKLIARLFDLERYGDALNGRIKDRYAEARSDYDLAEGELRSYAEYTEEEFVRLRTECELLKNQKNALDAEYVCFAKEYEAVKTAYEKYGRYKELDAERQALVSIDEDMKRKRTFLRFYPVAKEWLTQQARLEEVGRNILAADQRIKSAREAQKDALRQLEILKEKRSSCDFDRILSEKQNLLVKIAQAKADVSVLDGAEKEMAAAQQRIFAEQKRVRAAEEEIAALNNAEKRTSAALASAASEDAEELLLGGFESALLQAEYRSAHDYFAEKQSELHRDFQDGELYRRVDSAISERMERYGRLLSGEKTKDMGELLQRYRGEQVRREKLKGELLRIRQQREHTMKDLQTASGYLSDFTRQVETLQEKKRKITQAVCAEFSAEKLPDFTAMAADAEQERNKVLRAREQLEKQIEQQTEILRRAELSAGREEVLLASLQAEKEVAEKRASELYSGLPGEMSAKDIADAVPDEQALRADIENYDRRLAVLQESIKVLEKEGAGVEISESVMSAESEKMRALTLKKQEVAEQVAVCDSALSSFAQKLTAKRALENKRTVCEKKLALIAKLRQLIRGNGLMEFVAEEYLSEISSAATRDLLRLTGGRYFVRYKDGGFQIGDNFSGGEFRSVNTLSGGETFLVSLSLALALSEAIHAKSLRPIEFFFLDEGFGTLDEKLIDTVIDCLEKLKNDHFSIGLISHVEELKHRIENKIIVTGAEKNGSSEIQICH